MHLSYSTLVLCGSNAQFKAQLQNPALSCYPKGLNIVVSVSGFYLTTCAVFKLLSALVELLLCLNFVSPEKPLHAAHVILLKHLNDHYLAAVIAIHIQSFQMSVL